MKHVDDWIVWLFLHPAGVWIVGALMAIAITATVLLVGVEPAESWPPEPGWR